VYAGRERYAEAKSLYQRALAIEEKVYGSDHPKLLTVLNNMVDMYNEMGKPENAKPLEDRIQKIRGATE
jgi:tetratricopeptide (TPR) repeat protein